MQTHLTPLALALAAALAAVSLPARAGVVVTGPYASSPNYGGPLDGQDLHLPGVRFWFASGSPGSFAATAGAQVDLGGLAIGSRSSGVATVADAGTVMRLHGGDSRLEVGVGAGGTGQLIVSGGAVVDGRGIACGRYCGTTLGLGAGSNGLMRVTGAGSEVRLVNVLELGRIDSSPGFGLPGADSHGRIEVLAGGVLNSQDAIAGMSRLGESSTGQERSFATVAVDGAGSLWRVEANTVTGNNARATFASGPLAAASLLISGGGALEVAGSAMQQHSVALGEGGSFTGRVTGANSRLWLDATTGGGSFHLAENGGTARLDVDGGGSVGGASWLQIGLRNGGHAELNIGAGGTADFSLADVNVGNAAHGTLNVTAGGLLQARQLNVGVDHQTIGGASTGRVVLDGVGSVLSLNQVDSHRLLIGGNGGGDGALTVSGGALLDGTLNAAACAGRWCGSLVGQSAGDTGRFTVTGAGSTARLLGGLHIGEVAVARPGVEGWSAGVLNGTTHARVEVLAGGRLEVDWVGTGGGETASQGGGERSFAELAVSGAGSQWLIAGDNASLNLARTRGAETTLTVSDGGLLRVAGNDGKDALVDLTAGGGRSVTTVTGAGSRLEIVGAISRLVAGRAAGGNALLIVKDGARLEQDGSSGSMLTVGEALSQGAMEIRSGGQVSGARQVNVGSGGSGSLVITGAGSLLSTDRRGSFVGQLNVGSSGSGRLDVLDGGAASVFALQVGSGFVHAGNTAAVLIDGAGSRLTADALDWHRLGLENGSLTISGGGVLDAASNAAGCVGHWCGAFLANNAGGDVRLTVTGTGSRASFLSNFIAGGSYVTAPPGTPYSLGEPGAASRVLIEVLDGGVLTTEQASLGYGPQGPAALGTEAATVKVKLDGAGSRWTLTPNTQGGSNGATTLVTGLNGGANTDVAIAVSGGARLELVAQAGQTANLQLARDGGTTALSVVGAGSELAMSGGTTRTLLIGRNQGQASVVLMDGGRLNGASNVVVGLNQGSSAATGFLMLDGTQTRGQIAGDLAQLRVGVGAWGNTQLTGGAQLGVVGSQGAIVTVGSYNNQAGAGMMMLDGAGTRLDVQTGGGGAGSNASMTVGSAWGLMNIDNGAQLRLEGGFESTPAAARLTTLTIGSSTTLGSSVSAGQGFMTVRGNGSRVEVAGADPRVMIGMNGGLGIATVQDGAVLATSYVGVGGNGGQGQLNLSAARVELAGQWTSQLLGPRLAVGFGSGSTGLVRLAAGAEVLLDGRGGPDRAALVLGGVTGTTLGSGRLLASGGSSLTLLGAGSALFGQTGTGIGEFSGASSLDLDGGTLFIGRYAGATGELHLREASQALAGTVLVGASTVGADGGKGWLHVTSGSALHASRLDIGSTSLLSGSGLIDVALVTNRGSINPGDSPGTLRFTGDFVNEAGGRIVLEVESDGQGGFVTDHLDFATGASLQLGGAQIEFRFLGTTDPNAFQASGGFGLDSFLSQGGTPLDTALLAGASYSASSSAYQFTSFSFTTAGGAVFQAQAVPEPGTWGLFALGLGLGAWLQRRRPRQT